MTTTQYSKPGYFIGLDLGKKRDYTALAVLKQRVVPNGTEYAYDLVHLDRWRGRNYQDVIPETETVITRLRHLAIREHFEATGDGSVGGGEPFIALVVDQTGVGESVIEDLRGAGLGCIGITITGGDSVHRQSGGFRVPKRELVGTLEVLTQNRRLGISSEMKHADTLVAEMDNFRAKTTISTGHDTYGAGEDWREGNHDDLVLAVAMAAWFGEDQNPVGRNREIDDIIDEMNDELS